jgi:hypothetical protein
VSRRQEQDDIVKVFNFAWAAYQQTSNGGSLASLDLAVRYERAMAIDHAMAAIADAAQTIMRELHPYLPGADGERPPA